MDKKIWRPVGAAMIVALLTACASAQGEQSAMGMMKCPSSGDMRCDMEMKMGDMSARMSKMQEMMKMCSQGGRGCAMDKMMGDMKSMHSMMGMMMKDMESMPGASSAAPGAKDDHDQHDHDKK